MDAALVGLTLGGAAGLALGSNVGRLLRAVALLALLAAGWLAFEQGTEAVRLHLQTAAAWLEPRSELVGGAVAGLLVGSWLQGLLPPGRRESC